LTVKTGELLVQRGVATPQMIAQALQEGHARGERLCSRLLEMGVPEPALASALAENMGVPGVDLSNTVVPLEVLDLVPRMVAESDLILPVSGDGGRLHIAMAAPNNERIVAEVRFVTGREVSLYVAVGRSIRRAIAQAYDARARGQKVWKGAPGLGDAPSLAVALPGMEEEVVDVEAMEEPIEAAQVEGDAIEVPIDDDEPMHLVPLSVDPREAAAADEGEVVATVRADGRRLVLVVDDEPEIRLLVQKTLEARGFAVEIAEDGAEALAKAEALVPDLVLLDAMLPKVHGFEACRRLKSGPRTRHVPVIMMTAIYRGWRFAQDARETYGAEDYVEKPFRRDDFLRRIDAVLESTASRAKPAPSGVEGHLASAKELLVAGRLPEAIAALEQAIVVDPWSAEAHYQLARALRAQKDDFRAMTAFERATELRPGHLPSLRALASLYEEKGFRRKAAETLERALVAAADEATRGAIKKDLLGLLG